MIHPPFSEPLEGLEQQAGAFLFDCDGTLVDTMGAHHASWEATFRSLHPGPVELDYGRFCALGGMSGLEVAERLSVWVGVSHDLGELVRRKREHFLSREEACPAIEPVAALARRLAGEGRPMAVVSGGHRAAVERTLLLAGLRGLFPVVVTPEDVLRGKPAPDMYLLAADRLGVAPSECLVLEDGPPGVDAAVAAGMRVVGIGAAAIERLEDHRTKKKNERKPCPYRS